MWWGYGFRDPVLILRFGLARSPGRLMDASKVDLKEPVCKNRFVISALKRCWEGSGFQTEAKAAQKN